MPNYYGSIVDIGALERQTASSGEDPMIIYVDINNNSGIEDGTAEYPYNTIQEAIDAASGNDSVEVLPGTYVENIDFLDRTVLVKSIAGPYVTVIMPYNAYNPTVKFHNNANNMATLEGFTIRDGQKAISCQGASPTLKNNIIKQNITLGFAGAGIYCYESSPLIINNLIVENTAANGAGIYCNESSPQIINCTIANNIAGAQSGYGGGIYCEWQSNPNITNTIIWGNTAGHEPQIGAEFQSNPVVSYSDVQNGSTTNNNINANPLLTSNYKLGNFSPCIDRANDSEAPALDLENHARHDDVNVTNYQGSIVDIGALERQTNSQDGGVNRKIHQLPLNPGNLR